ncbi:MAG: dihydrofolate reductase [Tannerella sp.]|uniref:dihydrofolate reductase n=1 Tax=Tannerella sp. TaxID=2382127 RepID=UPI003FA34292
MISIIVATDQRGAIGKDNSLLWRLPNDMKHFRELTVGHTVVMGRRTFESLPKGALPDRRNIVLTTEPGARFDGCTVYNTLWGALMATEGEDEVFIIGGGNVYEQALEVADKLYLTLVHHTFPEADTFFPPVDPNVWEEVSRTDAPTDEKNPYPHSFLTYIRKK